MDNLNRETMNNGRTKATSQTSEAASDLLKDGKKLVDELYKEGMSRVSDAQDEVMEYSDELMKKVRENPLTSVLIAGGIGFLLSMILKK